MPPYDRDFILRLNDTSERNRTEISNLEVEIHKLRVQISISNDIKESETEFRNKWPAVNDAYKQYRMMYKLHI